jgi:hypothetical protein
MVFPFTEVRHQLARMHVQGQRKPKQRTEGHVHSARFNPLEIAVRYFRQGSDISLRKLPLLPRLRNFFSHGLQKRLKWHCYPLWIVKVAKRGPRRGAPSKHAVIAMSYAGVAESRSVICEGHVRFFPAKPPRSGHSAARQVGGLLFIHAGRYYVADSAALARIVARC